MGKLKWEVLAGEIREAWRELWHNASLLGTNWGDLAEAEEPMIDEWIALMIPLWADGIQESLFLDHGVTWKLSMYGRSGATCAPVDLACYGYRGEYSRDLGDGALRYDDCYRDLNGYNHDYRILGALGDLNMHVKSYCDDMPQLWEKAKVDFGWTFDEDDDDPMTEVATVADVPAGAMLVTDSQDTEAIKRMYPETADEYDGFFVIVGDGEYTAVWGFHGLIPDLNKPVSRVD